VSQHHRTILSLQVILPIDQPPYSSIYKPSCPFSLQSRVLSDYGKTTLVLCVLKYALSASTLSDLAVCMAYPVLALAKSQGAGELTYVSSYEVSAPMTRGPSYVCFVLMNYCQQYL